MGSRLFSLEVDMRHARIGPIASWERYQNNHFIKASNKILDIIKHTQHKQGSGKGRKEKGNE